LALIGLGPAKPARRITPAARVSASGKSGKSPVDRRSRDSKYVGAWSRLAEAVLGAGQGEPPHVPPDNAVVKDATRIVDRYRAEATLTDALAGGATLEGAACQAAAALASTQDWRDLNTGWALAEGLGRLPGGGLASTLGHSVLLHRRRHFDRVWSRIRELSHEVLREYIPVEAVDAALAAGTSTSREVAFAIGTPDASIAPDVLVDLAGRFLAFGERERARALIAELERRPSADLDQRRRYARTLIEGWLDAEPPDVPSGSVPFAVLDYQTPDHVLTSGNLGDYVQSLAMLGNLVRLSDVTFSGEAGLGELATELKETVRSDVRLTGVSGAVHLISVDREFSSATEVPVDTWMFAFGWHMHPLYDLRYDFPYHPNIRPLFISFHVNRGNRRILQRLRQHHHRRSLPPA
jgi:hypothetical protein